MLSKNAINFLDDLKNNNHTNWMKENKERYSAFKKDYYSFTEALIHEMQTFDTQLNTLEVKNCVFRINRDIRFSKDKTPYKTNLGFWLAVNSAHKNGAGYYVHYEKENSFIAGGVWCPMSPDLKKIRKEISFFYEELDQIFQNKSFQSLFKGFDNQETNILKKAPKGYDPNHPALKYLKYKSFTVSCPIQDSLFLAPNAIHQIANKLKILKPLNHFFDRALTTED